MPASEVARLKVSIFGDPSDLNRMLRSLPRQAAQQLQRDFAAATRVTTSFYTQQAALQNNFHVRSVSSARQIAQQLQQIANQGNTALVRSVQNAAQQRTRILETFTRSEARTVQSHAAHIAGIERAQAQASIRTAQDAARERGRIADDLARREKRAAEDRARGVAGAERQQARTSRPAPSVGGFRGIAGLPFLPVSPLGAAGVFAAASLAKAATDAVSYAGDFEQSMNVLQAATRASDAQMRQLSATARQLGADTKLPATSSVDAATALLELAKGGLAVDDAMKAARGTLQLAAVASISAGAAAQINANALNTFQLSGSAATRVADLLAASSMAASGEVTDMASALQQTGAVAHSAGLSIGDTATSIALLAKNGILGSDAGTSLKTAILALTAPSDQAREVMKGLGISVYDTAGRMRPWREIIDQVSRSTNGLTQEQRDFALKTIFGTDAIRTANIVMAGGVKQFDEMARAVNRSGAAAELAAAKTKGYKGAVDGLSSAWASFLEKRGTPVIGFFEGVIRQLTDGIPLLDRWIDRLGKMASGGAPKPFSFVDLTTNAGPTAAQAHEKAGKLQNQITVLRDLQVEARTGQRPHRYGSAGGLGTRMNEDQRRAILEANRVTAASGAAEIERAIQRLARERDAAKREAARREARERGVTPLAAGPQISLSPLAASIKTPLGEASCGYFASEYLRQQGVNIPRMGGAKALRDAAIAAGAVAIPDAQRRANDLVVWRGPQYGAQKFNEGGQRVGYHVGVVGPNGEIFDSSGAGPGNQRARAFRDGAAATVYRFSAAAAGAGGSNATIAAMMAGEDTPAQAAAKAARRTLKQQQAEALRLAKQHAQNLKRVQQETQDDLFALTKGAELRRFAVEAREIRQTAAERRAIAKGNIPLLKQIAEAERLALQDVHKRQSVHILTQQKEHQENLLRLQVEAARTRAAALAPWEAAVAAAQQPRGETFDRLGYRVGGGGTGENPKVQAEEAAARVLAQADAEAARELEAAENHQRQINLRLSDSIDEARARYAQAAGTTDHYAEALREASRAGDILTEAQRQAVRAAVDWDRATEDLIRRQSALGQVAGGLQSVFEGAFDGILSGQKNFAGQMIDGFKRLAAQILSTWAAAKVTQGIIGWLDPEAARGMGLGASPLSDLFGRRRETAGAPGSVPGTGGTLGQVGQALGAAGTVAGLLGGKGINRIFGTAGNVLGAVDTLAGGRSVPSSPGGYGNAVPVFVVNLGAGGMAGGGGGGFPGTPPFMPGGGGGKIGTVGAIGDFASQFGGKVGQVGGVVSALAGLFGKGGGGGGGGRLPAGTVPVFIAGAAPGVFGAAGQKKKGGGLFGSILGAVTGFATGGWAGAAAGAIQGYADGGSPPVGRVSIVGERGPELFVPRVAGRIVPNHEIAAGGGAVHHEHHYNVRIDTVNEASDGDSMARLLAGRIARRSSWAW